MGRPQAQTFDAVGWKGLSTILSGFTAQEGALLAADNVEMALGDLRRARNFRNFMASTITGYPLAIVPYQLADGSYQLVVITSEKVYSYLNASTGFTSEGDYTGVSSRRVSWTNFGGSLLFTDDTNAVQKYDGTTLAALGGLTNVLAKSITSFWSFCFLISTTETGNACPNRVKWSDIGDAADWSTGLSDGVDLIDSYGECQTALPLGNKLLVYKDRAIYAGSYIGLPQVFDWNLLTARMGILAPGSLAEFGGMHFFLGQDNVYAYNGYGDPTPIGEPVIEEILGPRRTSAQLQRSIGMYLSHLREYWLVVPMSPAEYPTKLFRFHIPSQTWWPRVVSGTIRSVGEWFSVDPLVWEAIPGTDTWNDFGASETWNEIGGLAQNELTPLIGVPSSTNGMLQEPDETDVTSGEAYYITKDYLFPFGTRMLEYNVEARGAGGQLTCSYSTDEGGTWTSLGTVTLTGDEWQWAMWTLNVTANVIRFKVVIASADVSIRKRSLVGLEKRR